MNWCWTDDKLMMNWLRTDDELMMSWWWADDELMKNWWRNNDELMMNLLWADDELMVWSGLDQYWRVQSRYEQSNLNVGSDGLDGYPWTDWLLDHLTVIKILPILVKKMLENRPNDALGKLINLENFAKLVKLVNRTAHKCHTFPLWDICGAN